MPNLPNPSAIDLRIGKQIRHRRRMLGLTQQRLGELVGIRFQQIQKYECGANRVTASRIFSLAHVLQVPYSYFFQGFDAPTNAPDPVGVDVAGLTSEQRRQVRQIVDLLVQGNTACQPSVQSAPQLKP